MSKTKKKQTFREFRFLCFWFLGSAKYLVRAASGRVAHGESPVSGRQKAQVMRKIANRKKRFICEGWKRVSGKKTKRNRLWREEGSMGLRTVSGGA